MVEKSSGTDDGGNEGKGCYSKESVISLVFRRMRKADQCVPHACFTGKAWQLQRISRGLCFTV